LEKVVPHRIESLGSHKSFNSPFTSSIFDHTPTFFGIEAKHSHWGSFACLPSVPSGVPQSKVRLDSTASFSASNSAKTNSTARLARSPPFQILPDGPYSLLSTFNTTILVDDSGSMAGRLWHETTRTLSAIAPIVTKFDKDGIDIYFTNHKSDNIGAMAEGIASGGYRNIQSAVRVKDILETIEPQGSIPIHTRLQDILTPYLTKLEEERAKGREVKPLSLIVLTDSTPSDDVKSILLSTAKKLDRLNAPSAQVGVHFFQVGEEERREVGLDKIPLKSKYLNLPLPSHLRSFDDLHTVEKIGDARSTVEAISSFRFLRRIAGKLLATSFSPLLLSSFVASAGATNPSKPNVPDSSPEQDPSETWHSILWGLGLIVCFGVVQWKAKRIEIQGRSADGDDDYQNINIMENLKAASEFSGGVTAISSLATLLSGCSERISETTLVSATVLNLLLNYKYTRLSLRQFKLERIYTATIAVV
jgi:hypothetical protein